jgi:hypothetical protein
MNLNLSPEDVKAVRVAVLHDYRALSRIALHPRSHTTEQVADARKMCRTLTRVLDIIEAADFSTWDTGGVQP